jgi:hypothetical protein
MEFVLSAPFLFSNLKTIYMKLQQAQRKRAKIKMGLQGPSGSGKTYSALLVAYGLCEDWSKIAIIDSECHSADLYAHLGSYNVLPITAPYSPERYKQAIEVCEKAGMEVIIIDSITHEWEFLLDYHSSLQGNSFTNWGKITPRHNDFVQTIIHSPCHIISTVRTKQDYVLSEKNGKMVPEKVGLKSVQRDGIEYEFTLVFDLDIKNHATASKDRTGLFFGKPEQKLSLQIGKLIADWCNRGDELSAEVIKQRIGDVLSIKELLSLYNEYPQYQHSLKPDFEARKKQLLSNPEVKQQYINQNLPKNGTAHQ